MDYILLVVTLSAMDIFLKITTGIVGMYVTQWTKKLFKASGKYAVTVAVIISIVLAVGLLLVTGELNLDSINSPQDIIPAAALVFTFSTLAYQFLKDTAMPAPLTPVEVTKAVNTPS